LIDPTTGDIRCSRAGLCSGPSAGIGFIDRCLIVVSQSLSIWDIVADEVMSTLLIDGRSENTLFAVNPRSRTFAVVVAPTPTADSDPPAKKSACECLVFDASSLQPVFRSSLKSTARTLLSDPRSGDYVIVDTAAQVMRIAASEKTRTEAPAYNDTSILPQTGLENLFGGFTARSEPAASDFPEEGVRNTRDLTDIFDVAPSFALPAVDVLFKNVVDLLEAGPVKG
jgi:NET1-associated nuclear protein 1 (U3 small nucleolar RNA-associated protein 17)